MADSEKKQEIEKVKRELRRRSLDQIKLYNPLDIPFQTIYEGFTYVVKPKQEGIFLRYIAMKWIKEFCDYMINEEERKAVEDENDKRKKKGWQVMSPDERDQFVIRNKLVTNDPDKRSLYMKMVYKGISQEHGLDVPETTPVKRDVRPQDEKLLEELDKVMGVVETLPDVGYPEDKKEDLLKEISE
jgi:hypothetical protein